MKFYAVYVACFPETELLARSLRTVAPQVEGIVVVNNGGLDEFPPFPGVEIVSDGKNVGVAAALNIGFREAIARGADCILTFDQDSVPPDDMVRRYRSFLEIHPEAGQVGCRYSGSEEFDSYREVSDVITSGTVTRREAFLAAGAFREDYFIDLVDVEYSFRLRRSGWKVYQLSDVVMEHHLGNGLGGMRLFGKLRLCYVKHAPMRWYYMVRNTLACCREYRSLFGDECRHYCFRMARSLSRALLFDAERREIFKAALSGIRDAFSRGKELTDNIPTVSVIVPNFNHAGFLRERLESILGQTYRNLEVIVLDDCSTDGSREIIESYRGRVSKIIYNEQNGGSAFRQWRKGINEASGEYVWIAESDDVAMPSLVEELMKPMLSHSDCAYSFCRCGLIDTDGREMGYHLHQKNLPSRRRVWDGDRFIHKYLSRSNMVVNASGVILRRSFAVGLDDSFVRYRSCGDWLFWILMAGKGKVAFCPEVLNKYRQHGGNVTSSLRVLGVGQEESAAVKRYIRENGYEMSVAEEWLRRKFRK